MNTFPEIIRVDLGIYVEAFVNWLTLNFQGFFDVLSTAIKGVVFSTQNVLTLIPWFVWILAIFLLVWKIKSLKSGLSYAFMIFLIGALGLWSEMIFTLSIVITSVILSIIIGIPLGIYMAYSKRAEAFMSPLLDGMQTMPSFVYLIPAMIFFWSGNSSCSICNDYLLDTSMYKTHKFSHKAGT